MPSGEPSPFVTVSHGCKYRFEISGQVAGARCLLWKRAINDIVYQFRSLGVSGSNVSERLAIIRIFDHVLLPTRWDGISGWGWGARANWGSRDWTIIVVNVDFVIPLWCVLRKQKTRGVGELRTGATARRLLAAG